LLAGRRFKFILLATVVLLTLWLFLSVIVAYRLTRRRQTPFIEATPALPWARIQSHRLRTPDEQELGAWFMDGKRTGPSVLLLHGNGETRASCLPQAEILAAEQYPILLITHRAHGDSTGQVNDFGYGARHDVVAAVGWLEQLRPGKPIVVFGRSLGSAAAVFASGDLQDRVRGYILECPYRDLKTAVRSRTTIYLPPVVDWIAYMGLDTATPLVLPHAKKISPLEAIRQIPKDIPILILAGGKDLHARPDEAQALHDRVSTHCQLVIFDEAAHLNLLDTDSELYRRSVLEFLDRVERGDCSGTPSAP
jgi:pimeloyl-ACP methyl ester carboxylesterase